MPLRPHLARPARALRIDRPQILRTRLALQLQQAPRNHRRSEPPRARRVHAVVHIGAQRGADHDVQRIPHAHHVPRLIRGEAPRAQLHHPPKRLLVLASGQAADREARNAVGSLEEGVQTLVSKAVFADVQSALHDRKQILLVLAAVRRDAAVQPADGAVGGFGEAGVVVGAAVDDIVQCHDDVRSDEVLVVDTVFGTEDQTRTIGGVPENYAVFWKGTRRRWKYL